MKNETQFHITATWMGSACLVCDALCIIKNPLVSLLSGGLTTFRELLLLGFISSHKLLTIQCTTRRLLLLRHRYFRNFINGICRSVCRYLLISYTTCNHVHNLLLTVNYVFIMFHQNNANTFLSECSVLVIVVHVQCCSSYNYSHAYFPAAGTETQKRSSVCRS